MKQDTEKIKTSGLLSYLKRLLTWERVTGITTIVTLVVGIIAILPNSETEELKTNIRQKILIVERDFNPEELLQENDTSIYVKLLVDFQQKVLEFCTLWQIMDNPRPYVEYTYLKREEIDSLLSMDIRRVNKMDHIWDEIKNIQKNILSYTSKINTSNYPFLSVSKMVLMDNLQMKKEDLEKKFSDEITISWNKFLAAKQNEKEKYLKEVLKEFDEFKESPDYYKVDDVSLEYWIETNKLLKVWKREILEKEIANDN